MQMSQLIFLVVIFKAGFGYEQCKDVEPNFEIDKFMKNSKCVGGDAPYTGDSLSTCECDHGEICEAEAKSMNQNNPNNTTENSVSNGNNNTDDEPSFESTSLEDLNAYEYRCINKEKSEEIRKQREEQAYNTPYILDSN